MAENYREIDCSSIPSMASVIFNHLVLEKILVHLEVTELKKFRLVCKYWSSVGTPFLAEKVNMILEGNRLDHLLDTIQTVPSSSLCMFMNFIIKINSFQSTNKAINVMWSSIHFNIKYLQLHITTFYAQHYLERLLLEYLPCIKSLKLVITKYWGDWGTTDGDSSQFDESQEIVQNQNEHDSTSLLPNSSLKFFQLSYLGGASLYGVDDGRSDAEFSFPVNWKCFFCRFPKIKHIGMIGLSSKTIKEMLSALLRLQTEMDISTSDCSINSLEILDENIFPEAPDDENLIQIAKLRNNFKSLHLEISPFTTPSLITNLLKKHSVSLKNLRLRRYPHPQSSLLTLTENRLINIKFLEISEDLLPSLSFLSYLPLLERFNILIRDYRRLDCCSLVHNTTDPLQIAHPGVKFVYIEPPLISDECIEKLSLCLPALETLKLRVNNSMLQKICTAAGNKNSPSWKNLRNLHIVSWDGLTDEGITGISEEVLKFWGRFSSSTDVRNYRSKPFIGDIPDLKSLTIEMWSDYDNHINDWSVLYGVLEIKNLEEVSFIRCGITSSCFSSIQMPKKLIVY